MKINSITRLGIVAMTVLGSVLVVTSQPPSSARQQGDIWPTHKIIPAKVSMDQMQEFKDVATLHLNDIQKFGPGVGADCVARGIKTRVVIANTIMQDFFTKVIVVIDGQLATSPGGGMPVVKKVSPAQLAMLYYAFDQGIDVMKSRGTMPAVQATPTSISGKMTPKEMGMTDVQFRQMTTHYVDSHPIRFWNEARVGLSSGR